MGDPISFRLDPETRRTLARIARSTGRSQSEVIREAISALAKSSSDRDRPFDVWKQVIGIAKGGPPDLSERTGERLSRLLRSRRGGTP